MSTNKPNAYGQSTINLHVIAGQYTQNASSVNNGGSGVGGNGGVGVGCYTNSNYDPTPSFPNQNISSTTTSSSYDPTTTSLSYDQLAARKSIDDHHLMKKQLDEQLLTKVSQMSLEQVTKLLEQKQRELKSTSILLNQMKGSSSRSSSSCSRNIATTDKEEFC